MIFKKKYTVLMSCLNLAFILLIYLKSFITKNNHFAFSIDTFFIASSFILLVLALVIKNKKSVFINVIAIILGIAMNFFNVSISYQEWIKREQPDVFTR